VSAPVPDLPAPVLATIRITSQAVIRQAFERASPDQRGPHLAAGTSALDPSDVLLPKSWLER